MSPLITTLIGNAVEFVTMLGKMGVHPVMLNAKAADSENLTMFT